MNSTKNGNVANGFVRYSAQKQAIVSDKVKPTIVKGLDFQIQWCMIKISNEFHLRPVRHKTGAWLCRLCQRFSSYLPSIRVGVCPTSDCVKRSMCSTLGCSLIYFHSELIEVTALFFVFVLIHGSLVVSEDFWRRLFNWSYVVANDAGETRFCRN